MSTQAVDEPAEVVTEPTACGLWFLPDRGRSAGAKDIVGGTVSQVRRMLVCSRSFRLSHLMILCGVRSILQQKERPGDVARGHMRWVGSIF